MEKVRPWCGQPSDRGRLRNRTEQNLLCENTSITSSTKPEVRNVLHCRQKRIEPLPQALQVGLTHTESFVKFRLLGRLL